MRRLLAVILVGIAFTGCAQDAHERIQAYNDDGLSLYRQGRFLDARESFEAALALKADDAGLLYNIAQCYDHEGNRDQAEKYYDQCLVRDPNHLACHHALMTLYVRNQRMPD